MVRGDAVEVVDDGPAEVEQGRVGQVGLGLDPASPKDKRSISFGDLLGKKGRLADARFTPHDQGPASPLAGADDHVTEDRQICGAANQRASRGEFVRLLLQPHLRGTDDAMALVTGLVTSICPSAPADARLREFLRPPVSRDFRSRARTTTVSVRLTAWRARPSDS